MLVAPPNMGEGPTALGRGDDPGRVDLGDRRGPHILGGETGYMRAPAVRRHASVGRGGPTGLPVGARRPSDWAMAEGRRTHCGPRPHFGEEVRWGAYVRLWSAVKQPSGRCGLAGKITGRRTSPGLGDC